MTTMTLKSVATKATLAAALVVTSFAALPVSDASAKTITKPLVNGYSKAYTKRSKAQNSAIYNWGLQAAALHGVKWAKWGKAKGKSMKCRQLNGPNKAYRCRASAKPAMIVKICKGRVNAKGKFWPTGKKALESARYNWGLKAAAAFGANYGKWGKSTSRGANCVRGDKGLVQCRVTAKACI